jgi:hypothetical protein
VTHSFRRPSEYSDTFLQVAVRNSDTFLQVAIRK